MPRRVDRPRVTPNLELVIEQAFDAAGWQVVPDAELKPPEHFRRFKEKFNELLLGCHNMDNWAMRYAPSLHLNTDFDRCSLPMRTVRRRTLV